MSPTFKQLLAIIVLIMAVALGATNTMPIVVAAMIGALAVVVALPTTP